MDSEHEVLSDKTTNNISPRTDLFPAPTNQAKLDSLEKKAVHLRFYTLNFINL